MVLPNELTLQVLGLLGKHDLKVVRLVCKTWSHYAAELLFYKLYISPREEDIRVFKLITQHPQLRRCVRELEYDTTRFPTDLPDWAYFGRLVDSTPINEDCFQAMYNARQKENFDPQVDDYLKMLSGSRDRSAFEVAYEQCKHYHFVVEGYRKWQEYATYQQRCLDSGDFLRILVSGLRNLDRLESVLVCQEWKIRPSRLLQPHQSHYYNSPFGRTWGLFRAHPMRSTESHPLSDGFEEFWSLITALAFAQRRIRRIYITSLPLIVFDTLKHATQSMVECSVDVYSGVEHLSLCFGPGSGEEENGLGLHKLRGLQSLLRSMAGLKTLRLEFMSSWYFLRPFSYEQILSGECQWTELISFKMVDMAISAKILVHLLTVRMPKLRELYLRDVEIVEGRWEGAIECMKRSMHLMNLSLWDCWHLGRREFPIQGRVWGHGIVLYILRGGRHPNLLPDEPDSASDKYLSAPWL